MNSIRKLRLTLLVSLLTLLVGCDQASKQIARASLSHFDAVSLPGGFGEMILAENPGSFLSLGASLPDSWRLAFLTLGVGVVMAGLFVYLVRNSKLKWSPFLGLALVLAGGTSNMIDRLIQQGLVTDFLILRMGPFHTGIFNLADFLIVIGVVVLAVSLVKSGPSRVNSRQTRH